MNPLCVCGLAAEARIAERAGFDAVVGTAGDAMGRAGMLISFGIAGGLAPYLHPGTVVLSGEVVSETGVYRTVSPIAEALPGWAARLGVLEGRVYGGDAILATRLAKAERWANAGGSPLAVDLESGPVARAAAERGVPFLVLRAIADPAWRELPPAALLPLVGGKPDLARVFGAIARAPGQLPALIGLARETRRALAGLAGPARALRALLPA